MPWLSLPWPSFLSLCQQAPNSDRLVVADVPSGAHRQIGGAADQLDDLLQLVSDLTPGKSLAGKLNSVVSDPQADDQAEACETLDGFIAEVRMVTQASFAHRCLTVRRAERAF